MPLCFWSSFDLPTWFLRYSQKVILFATSARKQKPHRLEQTGISLLSGSFCCAVVAWLVAHGGKASGYLTTIPDLLSLRSCAVSAENLHSLTLTEHIEAQKVLVKQLCRRATHRCSDVRLDTEQFMKPDVRPRAPTDPSRWTWKMLHSWRWKHDLRLQRSGGVRGPPHSCVHVSCCSSTINHPSQCLSSPNPVLEDSMVLRGKQPPSCSGR